MHRIILAVVAVLTLASAAPAQPPTPCPPGGTGNQCPNGAYRLDDRGHCRAPSGERVAQVRCKAPAAPYKLDAKGACHAADGLAVVKGLCTQPPLCRDIKTGKMVKCFGPCNCTNMCCPDELFSPRRH
jgi:hypothetical protein